MTKEYLESLKKILNDNHYDETDNIIEYYGELIEDRKEAGETEEEILNTLGSVEKVAKDLLGDVKVKIDETKDYTSGVIKNIKAQLISCDLRIEVDDSLSEIKTDYPIDERIKVEQVGDTLAIREFKKNMFMRNNNYQIVISLPSNYEFNKVDITGTSCDISLGGYSKFKVNDLDLNSVSGDISVSSIEGEKLQINTVSGDIDINSLKFEDIDTNSVSGDHQLEEIKANKIQTNSVSGDLQAKNLDIPKLESQSISGDVEIIKSVIDDLYSETVSGDIDVKLNGNKLDYKIEIKSIAKKCIEGEGSKSIVLKTRSGDIDYSID